MLHVAVYRTQRIAEHPEVSRFDSQELDPHIVTAQSLQTVTDVEVNRQTVGLHIPICEMDDYGIACRSRHEGSYSPLISSSVVPAKVSGDGEDPGCPMDACARRLGDSDDRRTYSYGAGCG